MSERVYRVVVSREGHDWLAEVPGLQGAHTYARTLASLDHHVREVIALVEDLPRGAEEHLVLDYDVHTGDPEVDEAVAKVRADRERVRTAERELAERTQALARKLRGRLSVRDCATLLAVSPQRVSQVAPRGKSTRRKAA